MINKINYAFVGETFIDWVRSNYCIEAQDREFFPLFKKAIEKSGATISRVGLGDDNWDTASLFSILEKNKNTITYCKGITKDINYLCEDSVHNLVGFKALTDIGFPMLCPERLGSILISLFKKYNDCDLQTEIMLNNFSDYLAPRIMARVVDMTIEYMGEEGKCINRDWLEECWGYLNDTPNHEWIASFDNMMCWDTCEDFIADHLCDNVIHIAEGNVYGVEQRVEVGTIEEICERVSTMSWTDIFKLWGGDTKFINDVRKEFGLAVDESKIRFDDFKAYAKEKLTEDNHIDFFVNEDDSMHMGWVFTIGFGEVFGERKMILSANSMSNGLIVSHNIDYLFEENDIISFFKEYADFDGYIYPTDNFKEN